MIEKAPGYPSRGGGHEHEIPYPSRNIIDGVEESFIMYKQALRTL